MNPVIIFGDGFWRSYDLVCALSCVRSDTVYDVFLTDTVFSMFPFDDIIAFIHIMFNCDFVRWSNGEVTYYE